MLEESKETNFVVYKHTSPSGKVYIGITQQSPSERFRSNGNGYRDNKYFWRAIKKYGWQNIQHEILYSGLSKEIACKIEVELIAKYNSADRKYGYNIALGGEHSTHSEETRKKIAEAHKGKTLSEETRRKIGEANKGRSKGRILSEETRRKISETKKGRYKGKTLSEEWRRKIGEASKGRILSEEACRKISEAKKGHVVSEETRRKISEALKNPSEETRKKMSAAKPKRPVVCVETGVVYESIKDAERKTGIHAGHISMACKGRRKSAGGFHWKFITQEGEPKEHN